jgi:5,10-methylenetetrahydrofolate reductase
MTLEERLKLISGSDAILYPITDKQKLCKALNYLITQYCIDVKGDEDLEERYQNVIKSVKDILEK